MSRTARRIILDYCYHITQRGNNKQVTFLCHNDYRFYLYVFKKYARKYGMKILAYCLMNNHVHFIAKGQEEKSFARALGVTQMTYTNYFNKKYGSTGHLWQSRFYSASGKSLPNHCNSRQVR